MPKRYEVLERSFINGRLYESGETVDLEINEPGTNLKLVSGKAAAAPGAPANPQGADLPKFTAKHNGGGRWIVLGPDAQRAGELVGSRDEAEAEADRLNAGGTIAPANPQGAGDNTGAGGLPDA